MINDATALVAFRVALGAAIARRVSASATPGWTSSSPRPAGIAIGLAAGWLDARRAAPARRPTLRDPAVACWSAYAAYMVAEEAHVSGVLGRGRLRPLPRLVRARGVRRRHAPDARPRSGRCWSSGSTRCCSCCSACSSRRSSTTPAPALARHAAARRAPSLAAVRGAVRIVVRVPAAARTGDGWRERLVDRAGAACAARSRSRPRCRCPPTVAGQPEILFVTVVVILVTLVGQGLTLPALLRVAAAAGRAPVVARRGDRAAGGRAVRARPARRARGRGRASARSSCAACASSTARASAPARRCSAAASRTAPATCASAPPLLGPAPRADRRRARRRCSACATRASCAPTSSA